MSIDDFLLGEHGLMRLAYRGPSTAMPGGIWKLLQCLTIVAVTLHMQQGQMGKWERYKAQQEAQEQQLRQAKEQEQQCALLLPACLLLPAS